MLHTVPLNAKKYTKWHLLQPKASGPLLAFWWSQLNHSPAGINLQICATVMSFYNQFIIKAKTASEQEMGVGFNKGTDGWDSWQRVAVWPVYVSYNPICHRSAEDMWLMFMWIRSVERRREIHLKKKGFYKMQPRAARLRVWSSQIESALLKHFLFLDMILDPTLGFF